ncbi:hypothetical protein HWN39_10600 [Lactobacillus rhamnosus]|uniref:DUF1642 domain-containing protein n=1 Tax=Lacticaseibacillus rhamnosus TaxID=47715 RepID=A0A7Y7QGT9_LACRH|nr:hypothetical protein [Lacticaseibacillus rhamnosus]NVO88927.1 hypothetical protein [Lacticaseibacillus rhamnosus]
MTKPETKRDVLEKLVECYTEVSDAYTDETGIPYYLDEEPNYLDEYDNALPDDLPVIPKRISRLIHTMKSVKMNLVQALNYASSIHNGYDEWALSGNNLDDLARAWLLEAWIVEETGKVEK